MQTVEGGMKNSLLISVVMPNYDGHRFVEQAIDSVLTQTYKKFELIIVDDCSKDDSLQLIRQKAKSDNRIRIMTLKKMQVLQRLEILVLLKQRVSILLFWTMMIYGLMISLKDNYQLPKKEQILFIVLTILLMKKQ